jgi:NRPS condensation-like uncharacterized protein
MPHTDVDPLMTTRIFREKKMDTICFKANHSVCDAGGLKEYVSILSGVYGMLRNNPNYCFKLNLWGRRDQSQGFDSIKDLGNVVLGAGPRPSWTVPQKEGTLQLHFIIQLPRERFAVIKTYGHNKKATINDVLLTALYRAFFGINNTRYDEPMTNQVSIDLRRYCPGQKAEAICNLSGALYLSVERKQGEAFEKTFERTVLLMHKLKENYPGIESAKALEYLYRQGYPFMEKWVVKSRAQSRKYNVTYPQLSNFGVMKDYQFGALNTIKGYIISPIIYLPGFMLGVTTFNEEMTLSIGYCGQENSKQVKRFLDVYLEELPS